MHKLRVYIDTSVIGGCFDEEFAEWSNRLFDEFISGNMIAVISDIVTDELIKAPKFIQDKLIDIKPEFLLKLLNNDEADFLASQYIESKAISQKFFNDALHIAIATINNIDLLVSWNFSHIVNFNRIRLYNSVNLKFGYKFIEIRTPKEVVSNDKDI